MQVFGLLRQMNRGASLATRLAAQTPDLAAACRGAAVARWRRAMRDGLSADQAARAVGTPRATLYRWERCATLQSRRPHHVRQRQWPSALIQAVKQLCDDHPMSGCAKIGPLVRLEGFAASDMTVHRIIAHLVARGVAQPVPIACKVTKTRRLTARRHHARSGCSTGSRPTSRAASFRSTRSSYKLGPKATSSTSPPTIPPPNGPSLRPSAAPPPQQPPTSSTRRSARCPSA